MTKPHVLVVEDDDDVASGLCELLEMEGYEVSRVANGRQALFVLDGKLRPAVIVLDMMMPIMDGHTFRKEQLQRHDGIASIPVIGWTAYSHLRPTDFEIIRKNAPTAVLLDRIRHHASAPPASRPKRISTRRLGVIAAVLTGLGALLKTILDHVFPPKGHL